MTLKQYFTYFYYRNTSIIEISDSGSRKERGEPQTISAYAVYLFGYVESRVCVAVLTQRN